MLQPIKPLAVHRGIVCVQHHILRSLILLQIYFLFTSFTLLHCMLWDTLSDARRCFRALKYAQYYEQKGEHEKQHSTSLKAKQLNSTNIHNYISTAGVMVSLSIPWLRTWLCWNSAFWSPMFWFVSLLIVSCTGKMPEAVRGLLP